METDRPISSSLDVALRLSGVTFRWAIAQAEGSEYTASKETTEQTKSAEKLESFSLDNIDMEIPRGKLVALVGRVGSGKSSLLQGVSRFMALWAVKTDS
jgi:ABC-type polysaccharide/polyol phosphate transport system ATPase subunit